MAQGILLTGPGTYFHLLRHAIEQSGRLHSYISYYPEYKLVFSDGRYKKVSYYQPLVYLMWALWRRIPYWGQFEHPRAWHFALYDWLSARHLSSDANFLWAWSGTSLYSMRKAKAWGIKVFLEFHASHPSFWNQIAEKAYGSLPIVKGRFGILPPNLVRRQLAEIAVADRIIVLSSFVHRQMIEHGVPAEKLTIIPLAVETEIFTPAPVLSRTPFRVLYVGRIDPLKGIHILLEAWRQLALPRAELWLAGHVVPEMRPILARYEGIFRYVGAFPREKLPELYRQATVFVFPTLMDSFGLVLLEAMASGLPVIATANSAAPDLLNDGIISADDVEALKTALLNFFERKDLQEIGRYNRSKVEMDYTVAHYIQRVQSFLESHGL